MDWPRGASTQEKGLSGRRPLFDIAQERASAAADWFKMFTSM